MQLPDGPSSDRHAWAAAAGEHGREVYRDDNNNVDIQQQRLVRLQHLAGWQPRAVKFQGLCVASADVEGVFIPKPSALFCANLVISRVELICLVLRCLLLSCMIVVLGREAWKAIPRSCWSLGIGGNWLPACQGLSKSPKEAPRFIW